MKILNKGYLLASSLALMASMCGGPDDATEAPDKSTLNIILIDSLATKSDDDIERLPENIRNLCAVLISDSKNCKGTYILDPSLLRLDLKKELKLKTTIEKGGAKDVTNPKVIGKLIQKNFDELEVPSVFTKRQLPGTNASALISEFISTKASKDSILVFSEDGSLDTYTLNSRIYKVFTSIDDVRNKMLSMLCENPKTNFSLLINPPKEINSPLTLKVVGPDCKTGKLLVISSGGDGSIIKYSAQGLSTGQASNEFTVPKQLRSGKNITFVAIQNGISSKIDYKTSCLFEKPVPGVGKSGKIRGSATSEYGVLTILKGSEGCDVCTRYYSATDASGKNHEVREKNSINCCPCGKTIEMKGRSYRMNCDTGGGNRLEPVE